METTETRSQRTFRKMVGILLVIQSGLLFNLAIFIAIMTLFMGGMAFLVGGSNAADEHIRQASWMIGAMVVGPFLFPILLTIASIQILKHKRRPVFISCACGVFIIAYLGVAYFVLMDQGWSSKGIYGIVPLIVPVAAIVVALRMRKEP